MRRLFQLVTVAAACSGTIVIGSAGLAGASAQGTAPTGRPAVVEHLTDQPDYSTGAYPWANDNYTFQEYVNGARTTYYMHGTFTAVKDPTTGATLSTSVHGSFEGTLVYTSTFQAGAVPYAIDFTYRAPKHWVFTENQTPGVLNYTQGESFSLEMAVP